LPHFDLLESIQEFLRTVGPTIGYITLFAIIFAESGLLVGFFLPGDSLLFTAGFLASQGFFNIAVLVIVCATAAITGDSVGYAFGRRVGRRLFERPDSRFFKRKHLLATEAFYEKHGGKTIVLARFLPIVRTFAPIVAGVGNMRYSRFLAFNIGGGLLWAVGLPIAGYALGSVIPDVDRYLIPIILLIIFISLLPTFYHLVSANRAEIRQFVRNRRRGAPVALEADKGDE
jgi:membrane-associated protein